MFLYFILFFKSHFVSDGILLSLLLIIDLYPAFLTPKGVPWQITTENTITIKITIKTRNVPRKPNQIFQHPEIIQMWDWDPHEQKSITTRNALGTWQLPGIQPYFSACRDYLIPNPVIVPLPPGACQYPVHH